MLILTVAVVGLGCIPGCRQDPQPASSATPTEPETAPIRLHFTDITPETGIDFTLTSGRHPATQILEVKGATLAIIDYDNDGDLDLFIPNGATMDDPFHGPGCRLFRNDGDLRFSDVTEAAAIDFQGWSMGAVVGDVSGDGFDDIYVACYGPNTLLINEQDGTFSRADENAGVDDPRWSLGATLGDIDVDGDLDLYVANYVRFDHTIPPPPTNFKGEQVFAGPRGLIAQSDALYENLGDGLFRDVTDESTVGTAPAAYGLGALMLNFDDDPEVEILVGNDSMPNFLFDRRNDHYTEIGMPSGIALNGDGAPQATMGIGIADVTGNGRPDVFTTNFSSDTNTLHLNRDGISFDDGTQRFGLGVHSRPYLGWACGFFDFDLDGDEDLLAVNGHVYPQASWETMNSPREQTPLLYEREGDRFVRATPDEAGEWLDEAHVDRAAAFGDLDGDGDVDVIMAEWNGPLRVLRNDAITSEARAPANWLTISLHDETTPGNHRGIGSMIEVRHGETVQRRWLFAGGFLTAIPPIAYFGLADDGDCAITITWPDGASTSLEPESTNRHLVVGRSP